MSIGPVRWMVTLALLLFLVPVQAGTLVRVSTSVGDFTLELLDEDTPVTVQNFLNYVNRGAYNQTYIHRLEVGFVAQGGGYRFQPFVGPIDVVADPPIVNEFKLSNTRGTVAMAKLEGNPDSATNQWFVNLADNSANLDVQNGGFTVFGSVLGDGMSVLDTINALPTVTLGSKASAAPFISESYTSPTEFVYMNLEVVDRFSAAAHVFEASRGLLLFKVTVNGGAELWSLNMSLVENAAEVVFQVNTDSMIRLRGGFDGMATYSTTDRRLVIPQLEVNLGSGVQQLTNVVLRMTDPDRLRFTLESYQQ
jgi:peptidyl-prolyl cis-trans isomerase A (cyclophilin A)